MQLLLFLMNLFYLILQSVRTEQERLQNDMSLAYQVYSQVANQLQVARAKVQEEKPVFAVVEPAVIPLEASSIGMKICILLFVFLSVFCVISWELLGKEIWNRLRIKREVAELNAPLKKENKVITPATTL